MSSQKVLLGALFASRVVMQNEVSESSFLAGRRLVVCPVSKETITRTERLFWLVHREVIV